jgi:hypothetical protein
MKGKVKIHGLVGVMLFILAAVMLARGQEPFVTYFYSFAWWSYILAVDALVYYLRGESLLVNRTPIFLLMIPLSIFCWCIFEVFNFRLANWHYITVPHELWKRWIGYAVSYGTVLPGLCETTHLLREVPYFRSARARRWQPSPRSLLLMTALGSISLLSAILVPRYCFPLVWIGFALLLEPVLYRAGGDSLLRDIERGDLSRLLTLLVGGLVCGLLWELWNFWAQTKWLYTVPFFEGGKLFEMPLPGFLGFPPFAVSIHVMYRLLQVAMQRGGVLQRGILWSLITLFSLLSFAGIDRYTVVSYIPMIRDLPKVSAQQKAHLQGAGMERVGDLLRRGEAGLIRIGIPRPKAKELIQQAEIITFKGMGVHNYRLLREAGVTSITELAQQNPTLLNHRLACMPSVQRVPDPAVVRLWVREAQERSPETD